MIKNKLFFIFFAIILCLLVVTPAAALSSAADNFTEAITNGEEYDPYFEYDGYIANPQMYFEDEDLVSWGLETSDGRFDVLPVEIGGLAAAKSGAIIEAKSGYAYISQMIYLEQKKAYKISALVNCDLVKGGEGLTMNIAGQFASTDPISGTYGEWQELVMYVETNVDEEQDYRLRIGFGSDVSPATGTAMITNVFLEEIDSPPENVLAFTLVGSFGDKLEKPVVNPQYPAADVGSDDVGIILSAALLIAACYLLITGKWAKRFGGITNLNAMVIIFAAALLLRMFIAAREPGHITDLNCFKGWSMQMVSFGPAEFYAKSGFADYPPGYMYILYPLGLIQSLLKLDPYGTAFNILIRLPAMLGDLALALIIYRFGKIKIGQTVSALIAVFVLLSPAFIADSAAWGQIDSVFLLPFIGSIYYLYKGKHAHSLGFFMLALMIKPQALLFAPIIAIVCLADLITSAPNISKSRRILRPYSLPSSLPYVPIRLRPRTLNMDNLSRHFVAPVWRRCNTKKETFKKTLKNIAIGVGVMAAVYLALALPMKGEQSVFYVFEKMLETTTSYAYGTVNAFNLFGALGQNFVGDSVKIFDVVATGTLGTIFIIAVVAITGVFYFKKRDRNLIFLYCAFMLIGIYMFAHNMHERYIFPGLIMLLFAAIMSDSRRLFQIFAIFTGLLFANEYIVLIFKADLIWNNITVLCSVLYLLVFAYLVFAMLKPNWRDKPLGTPEVPYSFTEKIKSAAELRLATHSSCSEKKMSRPDYFALGIILVLFSILTFVNLGSTKIPESRSELSPQTEYIIKLDVPAQIDQMKYFAGYTAGSFDISVSENGVSYIDVDSIDFEHAANFKWQTVPISQFAGFVRITTGANALEIREIGFQNAERDTLLIQSATDQYGNSAAWIFDEQELIEPYASALTEMYFDEVYHARTAYEYINNIYPYEITHPPLGKSIITVGIQIFGFNPFGWRFMGALFGVLQLAVLYLLAKRIFRKTGYAVIATVLFALDFMHFSLTRIATIDSFSIFFILLMAFFMYEYLQTNFLKDKLWKTFIPLGLCGISWGLGAATKWLCIYAGLGLFVLFFYSVYQRAKEYKYSKEDCLYTDFRRRLALTILFCVLVFIVIPLAIYAASYKPYFDATGGTFGIKGIIDNQTYMLNYHGNLITESKHPFSSMVYTWPFDIRPVFFYSGDVRSIGMVDGISCFGNPLIWWGGVASVLYLIGLRIKESVNLKGAPFVAIMALSGILPWLIVTREVFIYHYFATVPFLVLSMVYTARILVRNYRCGRAFVIGFVIACGVIFALFYPLIAGVPVPVWYANMVRWLPTWPFY